MKIYIVTSAPFPHGMASTKRIMCYARALREGGLDCEVIIYQRTEHYGTPPKNMVGEGSENSIHYRYIGGTPLRGKNTLVRRINDLLDKKNTEKYIKHNICKGDILFFYMGGDVELMLRLMKIAHAKGAYCIRDLCEYPYGTNLETKEEPRKTIQLRELTLKQQFPELDGIISISESLMELAKQYTLPSCKHIKVPILVDYELYKIENKTQTSEVPYIFHAGTLDQQKDGIFGMLEAFGMATHRLQTPIKYVLTGSIDESCNPMELRRIIARYHLEDKIEFVGFLYSNQIKEYLQKASLVISNRSKSRQNYYGFSTKVGEYLASGTPLITTDWGEANNWLKNGETAYIVEAENIEALSDAIVYTFNHLKESRMVGLNGQELCHKCFDYRSWILPLVEYMYNLGKNGNR